MRSPVIPEFVPAHVITKITIPHIQHKHGFEGGRTGDGLEPKPTNNRENIMDSVSLSGLGLLAFGVRGELFRNSSCCKTSSQQKLMLALEC